MLAAYFKFCLSAYRTVTVIFYEILVVIVSIWTAFFVLLSILESREKDVLHILAGLQGYFVELNAYFAFTVVVSCFIRLLQIPTIYELLI
jgi:hypothetical protein